MASIPALDPLPSLALDPGRISAKLAAGDRPYVTLKAAASLDGKIATSSGESQWITAETARNHVHALRAHHEGILVGAGTVASDDPQLTVRLDQGGPSPVRIILDSRCRIDPGAKCLTGDGIRRIVVCGGKAPPENRRTLSQMGVEVIDFHEEYPAPAQYLNRLRACGVNTLLIEGGAAVHTNIIAYAEADELFLYMAGKIIGGHNAPGWSGSIGVNRLTDAPGLVLSAPLSVGEDILVHGVFSRQP